MLSHDFVLLDELGDTEVGDFNITLAIKEDVVELDVPVNDVLGVDVAQTLNHLVEEAFGNVLIHLLAFPYKVE